MREEHYAGLEDRVYLPIEEVRGKGLQIDWAARKDPPVPKTPGVTVIEDQNIAELLDYIDWNPFFQTWELRGKYPNRGYPKIFNDSDVGEEAKKLHNDALAMLNRIVEEEWLEARGVCGILPANSVGDDIEVYDAATGNGADARKSAKAQAIYAGLRQQAEKETDEPFLCLSDFIASKESGKADFIGAFAVGVFGMEDKIKEFEADHDDYSKIMLQALGDRLAEAFAEQLHARMRRELWGFAPEEAATLSKADLLKVKYDGIRPAPGYPSQPDHTEKSTMWKLLGVEEAIGLKLTDSLAMMPASAVSALVFANEEAEYFAVGKLGKDQVVDYAARKGMPLEEVERWLRPSLNYDSDAPAATGAGGGDGAAAGGGGGVGQ